MIYVVEDDSSIRELVVYTLNQSGLRGTGLCQCAGVLGCSGRGDSPLSVVGYHAAG